MVLLDFYDQFSEFNRMNDREELRLKFKLIN